MSTWLAFVIGCAGFLLFLAMPLVGLYVLGSSLEALREQEARDLAAGDAGEFDDPALEFWI